MVSTPAPTRPGLTTPPAPVAAVPEGSPLAKFGLPFLYVFLFLAYSRVAEFLFPQARLPLITGALAGGFALLNGGLQRSLLSPVGQLLLAYTLWLIAATPLSYWKGGSVELLSETWSRSLLVFFTIVGLVQTFGQLRRAMHALALTTLAITLLCYYFGATSHGRLSLPMGMLGNPNDLAQILLLGLPFWLLIALNQGKVPFRRVVASSFIVLTLIVIAYTGSRSAFLAMGVLAFFLFRNASLANKVKLAFAGLVVAILTFAFVPETVTDRYSVLFPSDPLASGEIDPETVDLRAVESSQQRFYLLNESLRITLLNPLFGVGPGQFQAFSAHEAAERGQRAAWRDTHNTFTQISSEAGLPALIFYLAALLYCLRKTHLLYRQTRHRSELVDISTTAYALFLALAGYSATAMFSSVGYRMFFPTLAGLTVVLLRCVPAEIRSRTPAPAPATPPAKQAPVRGPIHRPVRARR